MDLKFHRTVLNNYLHNFYFLIVDIDDTILVSISSPFGNNNPHWMLVPEGGVHIYLCGQATQNHYLYLYPKMVLRYREYEYKMFRDVAYQGASIAGFVRFNYNVPFNFYESITYAADWLTKIICVEHCSKILVSGYGHNAYSETGKYAIYAYVFLDSNMLPMSGADRALYAYNNKIVEVPNEAKYCVATTQLAYQPNCVLCAITDKDNEILNNVVTTQEQTLTDSQKEIVLNKLGIKQVSTEGVFDIIKEDYYCHAVDSNIGDVVTPVLVASSDWCSDIIDVKEGSVVYFSGYETRCVVLDAQNTVIAKNTVLVLKITELSSLLME